ncbi:MAG: ATP-binding cassette domain-containing protein, partial [Christensenellaceae bacterium]
RDRDWDTYRNHRIGFIFQSYNLIPHQTVLENVEIALTIAGISKSERRKRAKEMLEKVGLSDKLKNKPSQLSGGQCQRVAIARALVNNPDILLADEPTGALDSRTSEQIMELLKEIAKDKLVIMVTHNPELAEKYSTRIIRALDGRIVDDTMPVTEEEKLSLTKALEDRREEEAAELKRTGKKKKKEKTSMSFRTALSLSFKNMLTKKGRTTLVSFAGSIGIIGIALILSLSSGFQTYIDTVEKDTLSSYPVQIRKQEIDYSSLLAGMNGNNGEGEDREDGYVYSDETMTELFKAMMGGLVENNISDFKKYIESNDALEEYVSAIRYGYDVELKVYGKDAAGKTVVINPSNLFEEYLGAMGTTMGNMTANIWQEILDNQKLLESQYELVQGSWPNDYNEVVIVLNENNEINDYILYSLGFYDNEEMRELFNAIIRQEDYELDMKPISFDEVLAKRYKIFYATDAYEKQADGTWADRSDDSIWLENKLASAEEIRVTGILRIKEGVTGTALQGTIGYTSDLTKHYIRKINESEIVREQLADPDTDVFTGIKFNTEGQTLTIEEANALFEERLASMSAEQQVLYRQYWAAMSDETKINTMLGMLPTTDATYEGNLKKLQVTSLDEPSSIYIYPLDFEAKDKIESIINTYNAEQRAAGKEENIITYTDYIGLMMSSITTIINAVSYVLIAFVSISLIVSSIMIGIITYISVLERIKEIGILRAVGASKKDVSRVFTAETLIIGFAAGILGVGITVLLCIPINVVIYALTGIAGLSALLPWVGGVALVLISMALTLISGSIPSRLAAKKDPVEALRSE